MTYRSPVDDVTRVFEPVPLSEWQPAFGTLSDATRASLEATFTPAELARLRFAWHLARRYELNEGLATTADELVLVPSR
jgi:hypothetical protein